MAWRGVRIGVVVVALTVLPGGAGAGAADPPAVTPLELGAVRVVPRCLGFGENAGPELKLSYALSTAARVNFTVQQRSAPGLPVPRRCPSALKPSAKTVPYTSMAGTDVDAIAGPGVTTVLQPGTITGAAPAAAPPVRTAPPRTLSRTVRAARGRHTVALPRAAGAFPPGRYRVLVQAFRDEGALSRMVTVWFWVLGP